ncbi:MAG: putative sensor protein, partial [Pseudonocardia sp.]|nr:putative sensor protein [Pseudonocardia sp.]
MDRPDDLLAELVGMLPVGIFAVDGNGRVLLWNAAAERLTGWSGSDVVGQRVMGPDPTRRTFDAPTAARILDELGAGRSFSGRVPATPVSGRTLYFR